ncbi:MAG: dTMP kinase [Candidatus Peribacteraceae bacterium]|nr:dTMP kinase [Candidatus Peribacteraceae bacterium]
MAALFIVLDGPDAAGTSTHVAMLAERLRAAGELVLATSEPTDGPVGKQIREFLKTGEADPMELQFLFTTDRAWHVKNVIEPALQEGKNIVCDRYWHSTIVYAEAQGLASDQLKKLNTKFLQPDCVIFTLPPLQICLERLARRSEKEVFEKEELQKKIHAGYRAMAEDDRTIRIVDTSGKKEDCAEEIWEIVKPLL